MYYFRADGNAVTGAGHLMRCLTIADELNKLPEAAGKIVFLCADEESGRLAADSGYETIVLHTDYLQMETELPVLEGLFAGGQSAARTFLIDSYHVTDIYLKQLSSYGRIFLLDDMGQKPYPVDGVINYNAFAAPDQYEVLYRDRENAGNNVCYIGSAYVPVRPQFLNVDYTIRPCVRDVLITTGGGDSENIAARIAEAVWNPDHHYHVVIGRFNPHFQSWKLWEQRCPQIHVHHDVKDMAGLMKQCDLAITAGGTTIYELAAIGVPFLCFSYAENQEALTEYIGREEIAGYCGAYHHDREETLSAMKSLVRSVSESYESRLQMHVAEKKMIDGRGAERIARVLRLPVY